MHPDKLGGYPDHVRRTLSEVHDPTFLKRSSLTSSSRSSARASRISRSRRLSFFGTTTPTRTMRSPFSPPSVFAFGAPAPRTFNCLPSCVPAGNLTFTVPPLGFGTSICAPSTASTKLTGTSTTKSSPRRLKTGCSSTRVTTKRSPAGPPLLPALPLPGILIFMPSFAPTPRTRGREREKPLVTTLYSPATTLGTRPRRSPRSRPRSPALAARLLDRHPNPRRYTVQGIFEIQPDVYGYILTFFCGSLGGSGRSPEDIPEVSEATEQIRDIREVCSAWVSLSGTLGAEERGWAFIVLPSFLRIREDLVGVLYLLETLFGLLVAGVGVGMKLARQPAVGAPDLILRGLFGYLESFVEIHLLHTLSLLRNYNFRWPDRLPVE